MKPSNKSNYSDDDLKSARLTKALGHPARVTILKHLASLETCSFNELSSEMPLAGYTVSQHLTELKKAELIQGSIEPPKVQSSINYENWKPARKYLKEYAGLKIVKNETDE